MNALSLLAFEEPINSGGMLGSVQVLDFNGSEWKWWERKLQVILFGSRVKSEGRLSAYSVEVQISLMASLGQPSCAAMAPREESPREGSQECLLLPWMPSGSVECFRDCFALYPPLVLFILTPCLYAFAVPCVSPVLFFHSCCEKGGPKVLLEGADTYREREMLGMAAEESM